MDLMKDARVKDDTISWDEGDCRSGLEGEIGSSILFTISEMFLKPLSGRGLSWRYKFGAHKLEVAFKARRQDIVIKAASIEKRSKAYILWHSNTKRLVGGGETSRDWEGMVNEAGEKPGEYAVLEAK